MSSVIKKNIPSYVARKPLEPDEAIYNTKEDVFVEIPPLAKNEKGEIINLSLKPILQKAGTRDIKAQINSYYKDVDLYYLLQKVAKSGDFSLLNQRQAEYMDLSDLPEDYHSLVDRFKTREERKAIFDSLPDEEKEIIAKYFGLVAKNSDVKSEEVKTDEGGEK